MLVKKFSIYILCITSNFIVAQNLLNTSSWTIGSGSVLGFSKYGPDEENIRELGLNHIGKETILWMAKPDASNTADGGWDTTNILINHNDTYRYSVWIKKTGSESGGTFFGCKSHSSSVFHIKKLNNDLVNGNCYFWNGDLPKLNRWYLLVGYIHNSAYSYNSNIGAIYDGVTGEAVQTITDFKFNSSATVLSCLSYLFGDTNINDRQYYVAPRLEVINGLEWPINKLWSINRNSELVFSFDNAGNQTKWFYALPDWYRVNQSNNKENLITTEEIDEDESILLDKSIVLYPNPTKGAITLKLHSDSDLTLYDAVKVYNNIGVLVRVIPTESKNEIEIDLSDVSDGLYLIQIYYSNKESIIKKIVKK